MPVMARKWPLVAFDPPEGEVEFEVLDHLVESLVKIGPAEKLRNLELVKEVLAEPLAVFEGLRKGLEKGRCYLGQPPRHFVGEAATEVVASRPGFFFMVCVDGDGTIYE